MRLVSTHSSLTISFEDSLFNSLPNDGGLWTFEKIEPLVLSDTSLPEIAFTIFRHLDRDYEIPDKELREIVLKIIYISHKVSAPPPQYSSV